MQPTQGEAASGGGGDSAESPLATTAARDEMIGKSVLGRYRIVARLARGGMGVVYLARAEGAAGFAKPVVVKRVLPDLAGEARMARLFVREAKILSNLQHPNVVTVIDFGEEDGAYIMVLDYVRAYSLGAWWSYLQEAGQKQAQVPIAEILHIMIRVLDALDYAHTMTDPDGAPLDIVHADISPSNILVGTDGQVKLLDFGIARMRGEVTQATDSKSIRGKFSYLPVEALDGSPPTATTDVYACGVVLYELLTGDNPFTGADETRTVAKVISVHPPPPSSVRPDVPKELDAIVAKAIAKPLADRFQSAKAFARALRDLQKADEAETARSLGERAKQDYAAMPSKAGASLADLDQAWRNPPGTPSPRASSPDLSLAALHTTRGLEDGGLPVAPQPAVTAAATKPPRSPILFVVGGLALAAVLVGGGVVLALTLRKPADDSPIVVIEKSAAATAPATTSLPTASAPTTPPASATSATSAASAASAASSAATTASSKPKPPGDALSGALAKNQPEIEACFQNNAAAVSGHPEIAVRISIDKEGNTQRAELVPGDLNGTPLGHCIVGVAKKTKFPPQANPATFRIPLRARTVGN